MSRPLRKNPFSVAEDIQIYNHVSRNGPCNWGLIAAQLSRTPKQCRERWNGHLNPSINKGPWTHMEDCILAEKQSILGNKWAEIAKYLPGRTDTIVKNRWNTSVKHRLAEFRNIREPNNYQVSLDISTWLEQFQNGKPECLPNLMNITTLAPLITQKQ
ncbi:Myb-like DNA-binding domain containing protein [Histomonas meleagridis]|uniref:Myb-like DNA-binding domain containing protein n=1 Tax=Histomonas meleagridis TaxID=135588 RepID=UPI00355A0CAA|nr:Myb-like DNA-binding domain containing protein [Histomonas meleagridis]KAH0801449.1 Myb-like DNA-binding domain containing protein [Histomonas meleagridis]